MENKKTKIICISNHKGGVGKTCSTGNISAGLAKEGKTVLMIDLDPQSNLSQSFGLQDVDTSIYDVLKGREKISDLICPITENLDIVPSSLDLSGAELELASVPGREVILKSAIEEIIGKYDYIIIDCPPNIGILTSSALTAADEVFIPVQSQYFSVKGLAKHTDVINLVKKNLNKNLKIGGMFTTLYESRTVLSQDIAESLEENFKDIIFKTRIRRNISLAEAAANNVDIFRYNNRSIGAEDYANLCLEILNRHEEKK